MNRKAVLFFVVCALVMVGQAPADEPAPPPEFLSMSHDLIIQPGHELEFEKAMKAHWKMHEAAGDKWEWEGWVQVTGKHTGRYSIRTAGHTWADLDHDPGIEGDREDLVNNVLPHVKHHAAQITQWDLELSNWSDDIGTPKMVELTVFHLKPGTERAFYHALKSVSQFIKEKEIDWRWAWGHGVSGHNGSTAVLAVPHKDWASFKDDGINLWKMLEEAKGRNETDMLMDEINDSIDWSENYAVMHLPDLGYKPAE